MSTVDSGHYETSYGGQGGSEEAVLAHPSVRPLLSDAHFCVDGTLIKGCASMKSLQPKEDTAPPRHHDHGAPSPPAKDQPLADTDTPPRQTETQSMHDTHRQPRNAEVSFRGGRSARTPPMPRSRTRMPVFTKRHRARRRCFASWGIHQWRTAMVS